MTALDSAVVWGLIFGLGIVTFGLRSSFILLIDRIGDLPDPVQRALPYIPTAVLAALAAPGLTVVEGAVHLSPGNPRLAAGLVGLVVAWRTHSMLATVGVGMAVLWLLQWF